MTHHDDTPSSARVLATAGLLLAALALPTGCATHIRPYKPKVRKYKAEKYDVKAARSTPGSLWNTGTEDLYTLRRSRRVGDLVTIMIAESAAASRDAKTNLSRSSDIGLGVSAFAGAMKALAKAHPSIDPSKLLSASTKNNFSGKGETGRSGNLKATVTARIKRVLPNGDYYIEGHKVVMVNQEESHLYISGVARPADIEADNTVASSLIADVQVEYTGRGPVADKQKPGWFSRLLDAINPF